MLIERPIAEPPFVEDPEPTFGVVIQKLNDMTIEAEERVKVFNKNIADKLVELDSHVDAFIAASVTPIDQHIALQGAVHGETKATVGLSKKDNFRTATVAEQIAYANVNAFVTPKGAKASLDANNADFVVEDYQRNGVFQFASYYYPDDYPTLLPTAVEPVRYLTPGSRVPILINGDRLIMSPQSDTGRYQRQNLFISLPMKGEARTRLSEVINLAARYNGYSWNQVGADTSDGKVGFFRPLADKKIYNFATTLPLPAGNRNYILYKRFANTIYKGLGLTASLANTTLTISHRFFYVNAVETAPSLTELITSGYMAQFDKMGAFAIAPANGAHTYNIADFVDLPVGGTIEPDTDYPGVVTTMVWNAIDYELYLNISVAVLVKQGVKNQRLVLSFTESIIPGTLVAGGSAVFKTLGSRVKDTLDANLKPVAGSNFFTVNDPFDFNNITQSPGVVLGSGMLVKAVGTKFGVRVKRYKTDYNDVKEWMMAKRPVVPPANASTAVFAPSRHSPFGPLPERVIPIAHSAVVTQYLVYGLDNGAGLFNWQQLTWNTGNIVSTQTGDNVFGVKLPELSDTVDGLGVMPAALTVIVNQGSVGVGWNALAFSSVNRHVGKASITFAGKVLTVGADVKIATPSMLSMQAVARGVIDRAAVLNPTTPAILRKPEIQVYAINATKALVVISDGVNYAEAAAANYSVVNNIFTLDFKPTNGVALKVITPAAPAPVGTNRESGSGDGVWMNYSDLQGVQITPNNFNFVLTRPFGNNYGDISFSVTGFSTSTFPIFVPGKVNTVRLYKGLQQIDLVEEVLPSLLIPNKGVFQADPANTAFTNNQLEVGGVQKIDPFSINETGWIRIPSGGRLVLGGKAFILAEEFALKVNPAGTSYCYIMRVGDVIQVAASPVRREVANNEVMFGVAVNGILQQNTDYLVMSNHVVSASRRGTAIPCFADDGANGPNTFFTQRDVL